MWEEKVCEPQNFFPELKEEQKQYLVEVYLKNGGKIDGEWISSIRNGYKYLLDEFLDKDISFDHFSKSVGRVVALFLETGCLSRKKSLIYFYSKNK